jgi:hypothetical protein
VRRFDLLQEAVQRAGAMKILFGSDGPWLHPGLELAKVFALQLSQDDRRLILGGNLLRLIAKVRINTGISQPMKSAASISMPYRNNLPDPWQGEQFPSGN